MAVLGRWTGGIIGTMQPGTSWAAPNGLFPTEDRNDSSAYSWSSSTSTVTIPSSGLPDGYLIRASFEYEDSSNGRHTPAGRIVQASGTGNFVSTQVSGYNRDSSEDRSFVNVSAIVDSPSASSTFQFQWIRDTDAPNGTDGTVQSHFEIIPLYYSAIGMYESTDTSIYSSTTPEQIDMSTTVYESDTAAIQRTGNNVAIKSDNKRYLILGGHYRRGGGTRTARNTAIMYDGTADDATRGYMYIRSGSNDIGGALSWDIKETATTDINVGYAVWRGPATYAADNGAVENVGTTPNEAYSSLVVIELNDDAEVFRTKDGTGLQSDSTTPTDLNISRTSDIDFNDSASWTRASDTAMNAEVTMDAFLAGNIWTARSTSSGARRTTRGHITVNGTEQASTLDGAYSRGDQSTSGTFNGGFNPAGFLALTSGDDVGMSQTAITGSEAGTPRTQPNTVGFMGINLDTLEASGGGGDTTVTAATETLTITPTNAVVVATPEVHFEMSAGAGTDGAAATSRITGLSGTLGGRFTETANPTGTAVDLASDGHRIDTWSIEATSLAIEGETYEFRVLYGASPAGTITQTPEVTISAGSDTTVTAGTETLSLNSTNPTVLVEQDTEVTAATDNLSLIPTNATVTVEIDTTVTAGSQSLSITETNAGIVIESDTAVISDTEALTITTTPAAVVVEQDYIIDAGTQALTITPTDPTVIVEADVEVDANNLVLTLSSTNATVVTETDTSVTATTETITITPTNPTINFGADLNVTATSDALTLTPTNADVFVQVDVIVTATTETLDITTTNASVFTGSELNVTAGTESLVLTPTNATVDIETDTSIISGTSVLTLSPTNASVFVGSDIEVTASSKSLTLTETNTTVDYVLDTIDYASAPPSVSITFGTGTPVVINNFSYTSEPANTNIVVNTNTPTVALELPEAFTASPATAHIEAKVKWRLEERPQTVITRSVKYGGNTDIFKPSIPVNFRR